MTASNAPKWMPTAGGLLEIAAGTLGLVFLLLITAWMLFGPRAVFTSYRNIGFEVAFFSVYAALFIVSTIAIIGGIFSLQRKRWGWALAGAICATLTCNVIGIIALVFITMSKKEFTSYRPPGIYLAT